MNRFVILAVVFLQCSAYALAEPTPIVLWHGMGDSCCNPISMGRLKKLLEKETGAYVKSLMIGENIITDTTNGFLMTADKQVAKACEVIAADPKLADGFNGIGFSQGGQFMRAYTQRCNNPQVKKLITVGGQHQGVFGMPRCPGANITLCDWARKLIDFGALNPLVQKHLAQANYWKDPFHMDKYLKNNIFLPDINNELETKNATYKENLLKLEDFVMVKFLKDGMVQPRESEWFGFYKPGQDKEVDTMRDMSMYKEDWLGLKKLDEQKKIHLLDTPGDHLQFTNEWFIENIVNPFLKE